MARKKKEDKLFNLDDYKDEIDKYIKDRCNKEISGETAKLYKKEIKNLKLKGYIKNLIILVLVIIIGYGSYLAYNGYTFNDGKVVKENKESTSNTTVNNNSNEEEDLASKYGSMLDNIVINDSFDYKEDLYNGNLTDEIKESISFANLSESDIEKDDDTVTVSEDKIKDKEEELFSDSGSLKSFNYNGTKFIYLKKEKMFVGTVPKVGLSIDRKVINAEKNGNIITLTAIDGLIKDNSLYNVLTDEVVSSDSTDLVANKDKLNTLKYTFIDGKLNKIEKVD